MLKVATTVLAQGTLAGIENIPVVGPLLIAPTKSVIELAVKVAILAITILTTLATLLTTACYLTEKAIQLVCYVTAKTTDLVCFLFQKTFQRI